jgi:hypothetical protein
MNQATKRFLNIAMAIAIYHFGVPAAQAIMYPASGTWVNAFNQGNGPINDASTNHPIIGDLVDDPNTNSNAADGEMFHSPFPAVALADGDKLTFTGTVLLQGTINSPATSGNPRTQFRLGLFQDTGSADNTGWPGYLMTNTHGTGTPNGSISRKPIGNTSAYLSTTGANTLTSSGGNGTPFNDDTYTLSFSIERLTGADAGALQITGSITGTATTNFSENLTFKDLNGSPPTYTFNRLGFLLGGNLDADRGAFSDLVLSATGPSFNSLGDFNNDTKVDSGDYVLWRKDNGTNNTLPNDGGLGSPIGSSHYNLWRANFGSSSGGSGSSLTSVPEPTTLVLLPMAVAMVLFAMRRRPKLAAAVVPSRHSR